MAVKSALRLALFQPDIPQNTGTIVRLCACLGMTLDIIEPAGFDVSDRNFRRAGMDYLERAAVQRHVSWDAFNTWRLAENRRLVLATAHTQTAYTDFAYQGPDILLFGRESAGVPAPVRSACDAHVTIPMQPGLRSLNVALAAAMMAGEALRQMSEFAQGLPSGCPSTISSSP